jgi:hypothetical protein
MAGVLRWGRDAGEESGTVKFGGLESSLETKTALWEGAYRC